MKNLRRPRKRPSPRLADVIAEMRELRAAHVAMRAELDEHRETLRIQFQRIAQLQAILDESGASHDQLIDTMAQLRRASRPSN